MACDYLGRAALGAAAKEKRRSCSEWLAIAGKLD